MQYRVPVFFLNCFNKIRCFQKTCMSSSIQPCHSPSKKLNFKFATVKIFFIDRSDFKFTPFRRFYILGYFNYIIVIEIKSIRLHNWIWVFQVFLQLKVHSIHRQTQLHQKLQDYLYNIRILLLPLPIW